MNIFIEGHNYHHFLNLYARYIEPVADTYSYCLLPNHFHLLVWIKTLREQEEWSKHDADEKDAPNSLGLSLFKPRKPSQQFSNLLNAYAKAINKAYDRTGSLFQNPFGRIEVTSNLYFTMVRTLFKTRDSSNIKG